MGLSYTELKQNLSDIHLIFKNTQDYQPQIQKIFSTHEWIWMSLRFPGKTHWIAIGRGGIDYHGIQLVSNPPESLLRLHKDRYLEYLRKFLPGKSLLSIDMDHKDKLLKLSYFSWGKPHHFLFFWRANQFFFAHIYFSKKEQEYMVFAPHRKTTPFPTREVFVENRDLTTSDMFAFFDNDGRMDLDKSYQTVKKSAESEKRAEKQLASKSQSRRRKALERKLEKMRRDLEKLSRYQELYQSAHDLTIDSREDWDSLPIKLPRALRDGLNKGKANIHLVKNYLFAKAKSFKANYAQLQLRLQQVEKQLAQYEQNTSEMPESHKTIFSPQWITGKHKPRNAGRLGRSKTAIGMEQHCAFYMWQQWKVAIGLNQNANDWLRIHWAKKQDYWIHFAKMPSAHAYIKGFSWDMLGITHVVKLLAKHCSYDANEVDIILTEVKNLRGVKGRPGSVTYKNEKNLRVNLSL